MNSININMNKYFHMIPLWKSPIKLPVELPVMKAFAVDPLKFDAEQRGPPLQ